MSFAFRPTDFTPLERFPLKWRWMLPNAQDFPPEIYANVQPLRTDVAHRVASAIDYLVSGDGLQSAGFSEVRSFSAEASPAVARALSRVGRPEDEVVVLWSQYLAVLTRWSLFRFRWPAFCHSAPGQVLVVPVSRCWLLAYRPFDRFQLGVDVRPPGGRA